MRIDELKITNFRGFAYKSFRFHPQFNLIVGENATGKTSILEAAALSAATWFVDLKNRLDKRRFEKGDIHLKQIKINKRITYEKQFPVVVEAGGVVTNQNISWIRSQESEEGKTRYGEAIELRDIAAQLDQQVRKGERVTLPLIAYYGTMRLWQEPRFLQRESQVSYKGGKTEGKVSRFDGYRHSVDPRISVKDLITWFAKQEWISFQEKEETEVLKIVRKAVISSLDGAKGLLFDAKRGELLVDFQKNGMLPFANLSDGQRSMLAMVADIAQKAVTLNPHLGSSVLQKTPGVVLIDELDLHLHPKWQLSLIESLRTSFSSLQFICTTHSPFLIQSLRSGEELILLDGQPTAQVANRGIEEIAAGLMGVTNPAVSPRYQGMLAAAKEYLSDIDHFQSGESADDDKARQRLDAFKKQLTQKIAGYADNPAFQAVLEAERISRLGE